MYKDLYGKPFKPDWMVKVVFLIQILLIFGGRCNRYSWATRLKIHRFPNFNNYALSAQANQIFQKRTVFVFTESWSRDQLMQKTFEANIERETEKDVHRNMSTLFVQLTQVLMSRIVVSLESQGQYSLRTSGGILLASPTIRTKVTLGNRSFQVATPKLWNALPRQLRDNPHLPIFIRHLETHLSSLLIITWIFTRYISIF